MRIIDFYRNKVNPYVNIFNGFTDFFRRVDFWLSIFIEEGARIVILPWNVWLGISIMSISSLVILSKAYDYFFSPFISIEYAIRCMRDQLKSYEQFNWKGVNFNEENYYKGLMLAALESVHANSLSLYGRKMFWGKPLEKIEPIMNNERPPYGRLRYDPLYKTIMNECNEPIYIDLCIKTKDFKQWIKAEQFNPT